MARKKVVKVLELETLDPRVYEIGFLLSPAVRPENLEQKIESIQSEITALGGTVISTGEPEFIDLAYEMTRVIENKNIRFSQGYFAWVKFSLEPLQLVALKEKLELDITIIRFLLIKTVADNTIISKNPLAKILKKRKEDRVAEVTTVDEDTEDVLKDIVTPDSLVADVANAQGIEIPGIVDDGSDDAVETTELE